MSISCQAKGPGPRRLATLHIWKKQIGNFLQYGQSDPNHTKGFQKVDEEQGHDEKYKKFNLIQSTTDKLILRYKDPKKVRRTKYRTSSDS